MNGLQLFARYAYPPNELGYCGPDAAEELIGYVATGTVDPGLFELVSAFEGPIPYLSVLREAAGLADLFDERLVRAYWVGSPLLEKTDVVAFSRVLDDRFRRRMGPGWMPFTDAIDGGVPHHSFHVLAVYPWIGMLKGGSDAPLEVIDRCRIRWGSVAEVLSGSAVVESCPLRFDGTRLHLGEPIREQVYLGVHLPGLAAGDIVSLHWDWVCDRLDLRSLGMLRRYTNRHLRLVNEHLGRPGPILV